MTEKRKVVFHNVVAFWWKKIKQMMLEHYGEVNQYYFDIMFSTLVRLNYKTAEEANERMHKNFYSMKKADPTFEPTMLDYLRIAWLWW